MFSFCSSKISAYFWQGILLDTILFKLHVSKKLYGNSSLISAGGFIQTPHKATRIKDYVKGGVGFIVLFGGFRPRNNITLEFPPQPEQSRSLGASAIIHWGQVFILCHKYIYLKSCPTLCRCGSFNKKKKNSRNRHQEELSFSRCSSTPGKLLVCTSKEQMLSKGCQELGSCFLGWFFIGPTDRCVFFRGSKRVVFGCHFELEE